MSQTLDNFNPNNSLELPLAKTCKSGNGGCCGNCKNNRASHHDDHDHDHAHVGIQPTANSAVNKKHSSILEAPEHVLSTLERDGSRRWLRPKLSLGKFWHRRRLVAYALVAFFVTLPHLRMGGKPIVLLDIPAREFTFFGHTFLPTDTPLLALGIIGVFLTVAFVTSLSGRLWCGWGCPQTVYMEFFFRPIDRFFEGTKGRGGQPGKSMSGPKHVARFFVYLVLSMALAHTFLAYFVGTDKLAMWLRSSPVQHPFAFLVMAGTTVAMLYDFMFFREQLCLIACPYGRFQSVMLDRQSLIVGYDVKRGEPRGKVHKHATSTSQQGDCIDCKKCVTTCPTGIDIRNGLQMECINCTQCIDACDEVMVKIGKPTGLIRYTSQDEVAGKPRKVLRARPILYAVFLTVVIGAFLAVLSTKYSFDARMLRAAGNPYTYGQTGELRNSMRVRLVNRSNETQQYTIEAISPAGINLQILDANKLTLESGETAIIPVLVEIPREMASGIKTTPAQFLIKDESGNERTLSYTLLGPGR